MIEKSALASIFGLALCLAGCKRGDPPPKAVGIRPPTKPRSIARKVPGRALRRRPSGAKAPRVRVYAMRYGQSRFPTRFVVARPMKAVRIPFAWLFYLIEVGRRRILIDTGFTERGYRRRFGLRSYIHPARLLSRIEHKPADITDVILTHHHFDHAGGAHLFPKARFYMHKSTWRQLRRSRSSWGRFFRRLRRGRVVWVQGEHRLFPWLWIEHIGGHTRGSVVVHLRQAAKHYIFVGDECYLQKACWKRWHLPRVSASNVAKNKRFLLRFQSRHPIPLTGHDPAITGAPIKLLLNFALPSP